MPRPKRADEANCLYYALNRCSANAIFKKQEDILVTPTTRFKSVGIRLPEPDEATWQVVKFSVTRKDGGVAGAELLRPRSWAEANGLEAGRLLPIDIEELQNEGSATARAIEAAPAIAIREGSAVTGRFITRRVD